MANRSRFGISARNRIITMDRVDEVIELEHGNRKARHSARAIMRRHNRAEVSHGIIEPKSVGDPGYGHAPTRRYFKRRER